MTSPSGTLAGEWPTGWVPEERDGLRLPTPCEELDRFALMRERPGMHLQGLRSGAIPDDRVDRIEETGVVDTVEPRLAIYDWLEETGAPPEVVAHLEVLRAYDREWLEAYESGEDPEVVLEALGFGEAAPAEVREAVGALEELGRGECGLTMEGEVGSQ